MSDHDANDAAIRAVIDRIKLAADAGRGVRLSAPEVHLLAGIGPLADGAAGAQL